MRGSFAWQIGLPITRYEAPNFKASEGVATLFWSLIADSVGLMPGVTIIFVTQWGFFLINGNSFGEAITPSAPAKIAFSALLETKV